ncbi:MAG: UxaA family hydrolase [Desulfovibrio sp.]|uniref:UxaA family hydrolase n=1 Tax=Desulfovibrio sp. TaxID=885 RepID=UPI0025BDC1D6|nr:UxaA family hydrolase [Desulfovibrio sp.]MCI7568819.1 UxaA family hydrolase [Desulfovibrio sp.]
MKFSGYRRPDGSVGIRNHTLIVPNGRAAADLGVLISKVVAGVKIFVATNENGRDPQDRATLARTLRGLAMNPNVGAVLVVGLTRNGSHAEFSEAAFLEPIRATGKPVETVFLDECGGFDAALAQGVRKARGLLVAASRARRTEADLGDLTLSVKCGYSDTTSGMAGNPVVGNVFDRLVAAGGSAYFAETTEVIGAEHLVARRFTDDGERKEFLAAVARVENEARELGQDIRSINPIPANIAAGLTTLEEKSLGAVSKSGTSPIQSCLRYGERPACRGLHFMDSWMSSSVLFLGFAAAGSVLNIFQVGGGNFVKGCMMPVFTAGVVAPVLFMTGNPHTWEKAGEDMDFSAAPVLERHASIEEVGSRLLEHICDIASGELTRGETFNVDETVEVFLRGHCF